VSYSIQRKSVTRVKYAVDMHFVDIRLENTYLNSLERYSCDYFITRIVKTSPQIQQQWPTGFTGRTQPNLLSQRLETILHTSFESCRVPHSHPVESSHSVDVSVMDTSLSGEELFNS